MGIDRKNPDSVEKVGIANWSAKLFVGTKMTFIFPANFFHYGFSS